MEEQNHRVLTGNRLIYLDALRGFAIILVVVGHLIQYNYQSALDDPIFNAIYSFHMPLFFFISGASCSLSVHGINSVKGCVREIWRKFQILIIPSLSWGIIMSFLNGEPLTSALYAHWFLYTLFVIFVLWYLKEGLNQFSMFFEIIFYIAIVLLFLLDIKRIPLMYLSMFCMGYYVQKYQIAKSSSWLCFLFFVLFVIGVPYFHYGDTNLGDPNRVWVQFPVSIVGSLGFYMLFYRLQLWYAKGLKILALIGCCTLGIYLVHFLFLQIQTIAEIQSACCIPVQFILLMAIASIISVVCIVIEKVIIVMPVASLLFYGKRDN